MAGAFGFEAEHYDISMKIGEQTLFPAIRQQQGEFVVVAEGVSCRQQIEHGTGKRAMHLVEALAAALDADGPSRVTAQVEHFRGKHTKTNDKYIRWASARACCRAARTACAR